MINEHYVLSAASCFYSDNLFDDGHSILGIEQNHTQYPHERGSRSGLSKKHSQFHVHIYAGMLTKDDMKNGVAIYRKVFPDYVCPHPDYIYEKYQKEAGHGPLFGPREGSWHGRLIITARSSILNCSNINISFLVIWFYFVYIRFVSLL